VNRNVEWVETTGKTVEEAKEAALDRLGVDEQDAEFEVIEEPRSGLFGRTRGVGRVRARVQPRAPRPKTERRRRTKGDRSEQRGDGEQSNRGRSQKTGATKKQDAKKQDAKKQDDAAGRADAARTDADAGQRSGTTGKNATAKKEREVMDATEQCQVVKTFLEGLTTSMGLEATAHVDMDEDVLRGTIDGSEVGLLIGPRLTTLDAIQEIARNVLQRHADGREYAKVVIDVAGVREMRRAALASFVDEAARRAIDEGVEVTFEVMSSADRKVVHDTVSDLEGVTSGSIGEDPRRRVVLRPA